MAPRSPAMAPAGTRFLFSMMVPTGELDNVSNLRNAPQWRNEAAAPLRPAPAAAQQAPWSVPAICTKYNWPSGLVGGGVIAIVALSGTTFPDEHAGWAASDMAAFFASLGQPVPTITDVVVSGAGNTSPATTEVTSDVQIAAAAYFVATGRAAQVRVYWADPEIITCLIDAVNAATADGCDVCSISIGRNEDFWVSHGIADPMEAAALAATQAGMVVLASAGDWNTDDLSFPPVLSIEHPAGCPHVLACGGTTLGPTSEVVWSNGIAGGNWTTPQGIGTGGGFSAHFPLPSWQAGIVPTPPAGLGRMIPDVSGAADPATGISFYCNGISQALGGTSEVAPLYAGLLAAIGRKLGFITPKLYANPAAFHDITSGSNGAYSAGIGPDPCTGLGSPNGAAIAALIAQETQMTTPAQDAAFLAAFQTYAPQFAAYQTALNTYLTALNVVTTIKDAAGVAWSFDVPVSGGNTPILKNGAAHGGGVELALAAGVVYALSFGGSWYVDTSGNWVGSTQPSNPTATLVPGGTVIP